MSARCPSIFGQHGCVSTGSYKLQLRDQTTYQAARLLRELNHLHQVEPETDGGDVYDVCNDLSDGVRPESERAGEDSHENRSDGEKDDHGERTEDAVYSPRADRLVDVEIRTSLKIAEPERLPIVSVSVSVAVTTPITAIVERVVRATGILCLSYRRACCSKEMSVTCTLVWYGVQNRKAYPKRAPLS